MSRLSRLSTTFVLAVAAAALTAGPALARDHDRMPDKWEKRHHLNVKKDDSRRDRDRDGLSNYGEYRAHTNPGRGIPTATAAATAARTSTATTCVTRPRSRPATTRVRRIRTTTASRTAARTPARSSR
jgi:hypothetical protein